MMAVVGMLALVAIAGIAWWVMRGWSTPARPLPAAPSLPAPVAAPAAATEPSSPAPHTLLDEHRAATLQLWRQALRVASVDDTAGNAAIDAAVLAALNAGTLQDRYFPRRPMLMPQLQAAVNDPDAAPGKLAAIISQDPVLTGNVLRLANSVFYRLSAEPVDSIQRAVIVCGTDGLHSLAAAALVQPVFRASGEAHSRFPATLWEHCTRASVVAEMCAREWCPADRQTAQVLALMSALGPLVVYRIVHDQYRAQPQLRPSAGVFLEQLSRHAGAMSHKVARTWQSSPRIVEALGAGEDPLVKSLRGGELMAALTLLASEHRVDVEQARARAADALTPKLAEAAWERLSRSA